MILICGCVFVFSLIVKSSTYLFTEDYFKRVKHYTWEINKIAGLPMLVMFLKINIGMALGRKIFLNTPSSKLFAKTVIKK